MSKRTVGIIFSPLFLIQLAIGQCLDFDLQLPRLSSIVVKCSVTRDPVTKIFTYAYSLGNGRSSTGCVKDFGIDLKYPDSAVELSGEGLVDYPRYVDRSAFEVDSSLRTIPVGIPILPSFKGFRSAWFAGFSVRGTVEWIRANKRFNLEPGESLDSIVMTSRGQPALRSFVVSPSYNPAPPVVVTPANEDSVRLNAREPSHEEEVAFEHLEDSINVRGLTIGPTAPPLMFSPLAAIDTLLSYKHQALSLGWITNQGIANSLDSKLDNAKSKLTAGDTTAAKNMLNAFVNEVEAQNGKHLSSEAYALLKFNAEYLIQRLE
jgi:hypothetical protein